MTSLPSSNRMPTYMLVVAGAVLTVCMTAAPAIHNGPGGWVVLASFVLGGGICLFASAIAGTVDQKSGLIIVLAVAGMVRLVFIFIDPQLSTDIYRYIWDGRVIASGINPYRYVPAAPELAGLRDAAIYPWINRADYAVTIYPPVAQAFYFAATRLGESVTVMKAALVGCEGLTIIALLRIMSRVKISQVKIVAYAWHPLPIWEIAGNGHVDTVMITLLIVSIFYYLNGRVLLAAVLATLGALVKPTALLALPVFWRPWSWRMVTAVLLTVVAAYIPFLSVGSRVIGFVPEYLTEEGLASGSGIRIVQLLETISGHSIAGLSSAYIAISALAFGGLALAAGFRTDRSEKASTMYLGWMLIAFLLLSSPHYPWYFLVLTPFLVLAPSVSGWAFTVAPVLLYAGEWSSHATRELILTIIMLTALATDSLRVRAGWRFAPIGGAS